MTDRTPVTRETFHQRLVDHFNQTGTWPVQVHIGKNVKDDLLRLAKSNNLPEVIDPEDLKAKPRLTVFVHADGDPERFDVVSFDVEPKVGV